MSKIKGFFRAIGNFIKRRPVVSLVIVVAILVVALAGTYEVMHVTSKPEFCQLCHPKEGTGPLAEYATWSKNIHAANGVECLDCHSKQPGAYGYLRAKMGGLYDLGAEIVLSKEKKLELLSKYENNPEKSALLVNMKVCMHCHTDSVNKENREKHFMTFAGLAMRELDTVVNPEFRQMFGLTDILTEKVRSGVEPNHAKHIEQGIACAQCHISVAHSGEFRSPLSMQTCFTCHDQKREEGLSPVENDSCTTCHVTQVGVQEGLALEPQGLIADQWVMMDLGCESCHADPFVLPTKESCVSCHDESYADLMDVFQEGFTEQMDEATPFYRNNISDRRQMSPEKRAAFNEYAHILTLIESDGSRSIHNPNYMEIVFEHLNVVRTEFKTE